jgi:hypothetical protein
MSCPKFKIFSRIEIYIVVTNTNTSLPISIIVKNNLIGRSLTAVIKVSTNKIILYDDTNWKAGIGVSHHDVDFYSGENFKFWTTHTQSSEGNNRLTILDNGKVGIGTDAPDYTLDVAGNAGFNEYILHNGDADTFIRLEPDEINIQVGGEKMISMAEGGGGTQADKITINDSDTDIDFQVKGTSDTNLIRTDAANDRVGIGFSTFSGEKDLSSSLHIGGDLTVGSGSSIGHITASGNFSGSVTSTGSFGRLTAVGNIHGTSVVGTNLYGTIGTAAQNSITSATSLASVGTVTKLVALVIEF